MAGRKVLWICRGLAIASTPACPALPCSQRTGRPLLCLSSRDDPIIDPALVRHAEAAAAANPNVLLAVTDKGGHLGWMQVGRALAR